MFMTLDPTSRRLRFPVHGDVIVTDTVGFISDLPAELIAAFRSTLEELADADLLLHVIDAADERLFARHDSVERLLADLRLEGIPRLSVLNKCDRLDPATTSNLARRFNAIAVSAIRRDGLDDLIHAAEERLHCKLANRIGGSD